MASEKLDFSFLNRPAAEVAPQLLGCILERKINGEVLRVQVVEAEAYDQTDAASHSYNGRTPRTEVMFGPAGFLYVYFTYGMHYCCNVVTGQEGHGSAVLIRAVEPLVGEELMAQNREGKTGIDLTNGPAKACQALGIDKAMNGHYLKNEPLKLIPQPALPKDQITIAPRIGITKAKDTPWRFYIKDNKYISK